MKTKLLVSFLLLSMISCETDIGDVSEENDRKLLDQISTTKSGIACETCSYNTAFLSAEERQMVVSKFAPQLRFDSAARTFPMSAKRIWEESNNSICGASEPRLSQKRRDSYFNMNLNETFTRNPIYTYYTVTRNADYLFVAYWWAYYRQPNCFGRSGGHDYDWEHITVKVNYENGLAGSYLVDAVYAEHSSFNYFSKNQLEIINNTHPVVYVGKKAHPSYATRSTVEISCTLDYANPGRGTRNYYSIWQQHADKLVELRCDETWSASARRWGKPGQNPLYRAYEIW